MKNILAIFLILFSLTAFAACEDQTPFGCPTANVQTTVLFHKAYVDIYYNDCKDPLVVVEHLWAGNLGGSLPRGSFHQEPDLPPALRAKSSDYDGRSKLGLDIGHLAPAEDFATDPVAMRESMNFSNTQPHDFRNNRGIWVQVENRARALAMKHGDVYVFTGGVYSDTPQKIGSGVCVPVSIYKIIVDAKTLQSVAYLIPNSSAVTKFPDYMTTIRHIECVSKINFLPTADLATESKIKNTVGPDMQ